MAGRTKSVVRTAEQNSRPRMCSNMVELIGRFGSEEACELHMLSLRWPGGFDCPRCGHGSFERVAGRREFRCSSCSWQFSATSGTCLAHTRLPLAKWFRAAFMVTRGARGASAQSVARELGVSDATGISVLRRLRTAMGPAVSLVSLFPGREDSPVRIGGYMTSNEQRRCTADPRYLGERLSAAGFDAYDAGMLEQCRELMGLAPSLDFQFDILQDGSLGPTFGLSLSLNEARVKATRQCLDDGYGAKLMRLLEERGLADGRWKLLRDVAFARQYPYTHDDGSTGLVGLCVLLNYVKVKFKGGVAQPSKFYIALAALDT